MYFDFTIEIVRNNNLFVETELLNVLFTYLGSGCMLNNLFDRKSGFQNKTPASPWPTRGPRSSEFRSRDRKELRDEWSILLSLTVRQAAYFGAS